MKNKILLSLIFCSLLFLVWQCGTISNSSVTKQNFATQYYSEEKVLRPKYVLYNVTDSMSRLYFSVNAKDLLYSKNNTDEGYTARILISYVVHPYEFAKVIADSGSAVMTDAGIPGASKILSSSLDMDILYSGKFFVEVTFRDLNKMTISYELLYLDHRGKDSRNNFLITQDSSLTPLFKNFAAKEEPFTVHYYNNGVKKLFVRYFKNKYGPALPPYATERHPNSVVADSSWWMPVSKHSIKLPKEGWYTFNADSTSIGGAMIARFHEEFPKISIARQLVYPLRYLTMREEYSAMDTAKNVKKAVDQFWIKNTGSEERAREVIRNFYNRVEICNKLFSTQMEGWKTDRGMVYLIFGPPENVFRNVGSETWIYGNSGGAGGLTFVFEHQENTYTDEEFILQRNVEYKINWITAVDSWRQGHVYTLR